MAAPAHFGNVDQPLDAFFKFHKYPIISDTDHLSLDLCIDRVFAININPGVGAGLLET